MFRSQLTGPLRWFLVLAALALVAVACGDSDDDSDVAATTSSTAPADESDGGTAERCEANEAAGTITYPAGTGFPLHRHDFAQVWYVLEGECRFGERRLSACPAPRRRWPAGSGGNRP